MKFFLHLAFKALKHSCIFLFTLFVLWFGLALYFRIVQTRVCAELPNGLLVGRSALFSFQNTRKISDVVLKLPDGTVLVKNKFIEFYFSETSTYGVAEPRDYSSSPFSFAYRPDIGFVLQGDNPEKYKLIVREAGSLIKAYRGHKDLGYASLLKVYEELIELPAYRREDCPVTLFP